MPQISRGVYNRLTKRGEKESKMKTFKHQQNIDTTLVNNCLFSQESKSTKLGKEFIRFIKNSSLLPKFM